MDAGDCPVKIPGHGLLKFGIFKTENMILKKQGTLMAYDHFFLFVFGVLIPVEKNGKYSEFICVG